MSLPTMVIGQRYAVRVHSDGEVRDVVGLLVAADADRWTLLPEDRGPVLVPVSQVRAARAVPPRAVRPTSSPDDLQRLAARGWPGLEQERLGGWLLRYAGGHTRRANSALVAGDPGCDVAAAIDLAQERYRERGLVPTFQVTPDSDSSGPVDRILDERGLVRCAPSLTLVTDLRRHADSPVPAALSVTWSDRPDPDWLAASDPVHPQKAAVMAASRARYLTLGHEGTPVGRARVALVVDWGGLTDLVLAPHLRGRGWGRAAIHEAVRETRRCGGRFGYLQVLEDNTVARGLYASLGWQVHHRYHYREAPRS
ncbi:GNAT family N-acetyltransferase [Arsenicicoccus dermatophilus]|uniref:GNAT family N-acetyltransferase n=1 Tax=Arsenicicoccus dermatophilus TaxID=1076331 RepID=UPI001F4D15FE|nr:GNAT family N-acetyltransferase [Arsenicicoccus dermatophilus]MCH8612942.1 GNAT family N-acetyltransferase [Arsenicicoccus dermatophilus]